MSALCLIYLTAAFDTVDHTLLLHRLERQFGLRDIVLEWFRSCLSDRTFRVVYGGNTSRTLLSFFVRFLKDQCLVRDCLFYTCLTSPTKWTNMVSTSTRTPMIRSTYTAIVVTRLQPLHDSSTASPTSANHLKLNADKTEVLGPQPPKSDRLCFVPAQSCSGPAQNIACHF